MEASPSRPPGHALTLTAAPVGGVAVETGDAALAVAAGRQVLALLTHALVDAAAVAVTLARWGTEKVSLAPPTPGRPHPPQPPTLWVPPGQWMKDQLNLASLGHMLALRAGGGLAGWPGELEGAGTAVWKGPRYEPSMHCPLPMLLGSVHQPQPGWSRHWPQVL